MSYHKSIRRTALEARNARRNSPLSSPTFMPPTPALVSSFEIPSAPGIILPTSSPKPKARKRALTLFLAGIVGIGITVYKSDALAFFTVLIVEGLAILLFEYWVRRKYQQVDFTSKKYLSLLHPMTLRLVRAYNEITNLSKNHDPLALESLEASHLALNEVGDLLKGQIPTTSAEVEYVTLRVDAVESLLNSLKEVRARAVAASLAQDKLLKQHEEMVRNQSVMALQDFEDRSNIGSLPRLEELKVIAKSNLKKKI